MSTSYCDTNSSIDPTTCLIPQGPQQTARRRDAGVDAAISYLRHKASTRRGRSRQCHSDADQAKPLLSVVVMMGPSCRLSEGDGIS